ncbi:hypothetical protein ILUMI_02569 [Ignelater luminosus]|uniref:Uncharacterized protein n=1 Tax=Ignelater luminosus TaxID=2038154 RepID=A0A8K0GGC1_IGNLU|nr:hypothetical protein ILUMI_02569 [Ignelater luminosus]
MNQVEEKTQADLEKDVNECIRKLVYVVAVDGINGEKIEVAGVKSTDVKKTTFTLQRNDEFVVEISDVLAILPLPDISGNSKGSREIYNFQNPVDVKEI